MKETIEHYLNNLGETRIDFDFQRSINLNELVYQKIPVITVCGTNGKGSTTAFLENILIKNGYRVGAYTSPHLETVCERIRINGKNLSSSQLETYGSSLRDKIQKNKISPTYFEFLTFLALNIFEKEKLDIAIFETGLGGRLDSTQAIPRIGAILTSVSYDHMEYLGATLLKIAGEKIPILQKSPFSVVSKQNPEVESFIHDNLKKEYREEGADFQHSGSCDMFLYQENDFSLGPIKLGLLGDHQTSNAACALSMILHLQQKGWKIDPENIQRGLETTTNPGRLERWQDTSSNEVWLDVAHNPDSIQKLVQYFYVRKQREFHTIFGCSSDKPFDEMIETLRPITKQFHWVSMPTPRSWNPTDKKLEEPVKCLQDLIGQKQFPILCTGSFYHVGLIRSALSGLGWTKY